MKFKNLYSLNCEWVMETDIQTKIYDEKEIEGLMSCRYLLHKYGEYTVSCFGSNWIELFAEE